jgi:hypothetical protein
MARDRRELRLAWLEERLPPSRLIDSTPVDISFGVSPSAWLPTTPIDLTDHLAVFRPSLQILMRTKQEVERGQ